MLGDKLKNKMKLFGHPRDPGTAKALMMAAEKGVDIESHVVSTDNTEGLPPEFREISPLGSFPCSKDLEFVVCGTLGVLSYLDDKGFGPLVVPRNGVVRAAQYHWVHLANEYVDPQIKDLMSGGESGGNAAAALGPMFDMLEQQLKSSSKRGEFLIGPFSLADIHWGVYAHYCHLAGKPEIVESRPEVKKWWESVKQHPSTSKEPIVGYDVLPTSDDVSNGQLRSIAINT